MQDMKTLGPKMRRDLPVGWPTLAQDRDMWKGVALVLAVGDYLA